MRKKVLDAIFSWQILHPLSCIYWLLKKTLTLTYRPQFSNLRLRFNIQTIISGRPCFRTTLEWVQIIRLSTPSSYWKCPELSKSMKQIGRHLVSDSCANSERASHKSKVVHTRANNTFDTVSMSSGCLVVLNNNNCKTIIFCLIWFALLQQALLSLATQLVISLLVADVVCAENRDDIRVKLFSSTLFMNGVTTLAMVIFGTRYAFYT